MPLVRVALSEASELLLCHERLLPGPGEALSFGAPVLHLERLHLGPRATDDVAQSSLMRGSPNAHDCDRLCLNFRIMIHSLLLLLLLLLLL